MSVIYVKNIMHRVYLLCRLCVLVMSISVVIGILKFVLFNNYFLYKKLVVALISYNTTSLLLQVSLFILKRKMPKKFAGENSKAVAARQRKEDAKQEKDLKLKKMIEDAAWQDDDDKVLKKQQKKNEQEKKRLEQLQKKAEAKALLEKEMESLKTAPKAAPAPKITRAQITQMKEKTIKAEPAKPVPSRVTIEEPPLEENLNRIQLDGEVAQTVDEAISILSESKDVVDKHPEKRLKAAYTAFEEVTLPRLKAENPTLRLSQLKQLLRKEWLKSPQNPLNQNM